MFVFSVEFPPIHRNGLYRKHGTLFLVVFFLYAVIFYSATFLYVTVFRFLFYAEKNKKDVWTAYFDSQEKFVTQLNLKNNDDDDNN